MPEGAVSEPWGDVWRHICWTLRGQQAQQALWPPNPLSWGPKEVDPSCGSWWPCPGLLQAG